MVRWASRGNVNNASEHVHSFVPPPTLYPTSDYLLVDLAMSSFTPLNRAFIARPGKLLNRCFCGALHYGNPNTATRRVSTSPPLRCVYN